MLMGQQMDLYPLGDLWHAPAYTVPGSPVGLSAIEFGRQAIGLGLAAEEFGARFFGDGAHPTSIISTDSEVTKEQAEVIKERIREALQNRRDPAVLGLGLKWQQVQINPEESQFLETIKANSLTIAKFFGLASAAELIGAESTASMTYANVSQKSLNLLTYGLRPWLRRLEDIYDEMTVRPMRVRAKVDDMLRVDPKTRVDIQSEQIRAGLRTQNELRREDNRPPVDGGDRLLWPPYGTTALGEGDLQALGAGGDPNA
jgi:HK97 family phage portal protein